MEESSSVKKYVNEHQFHQLEQFHAALMVIFQKTLSELGDLQKYRISLDNLMISFENQILFHRVEFYI